MKFQILRLMADGGEGKDAAARANCRAPRHNGMRDKLDILAQRDLRADMTERPDTHAPGELRAVLDNGEGMDEGGRARRRAGLGRVHSITSMALISASQTSAPSTFASPLYHQKFRLLAVLVMWNSTRSPGVTILRNLHLSTVMK